MNTSIYISTGKIYVVGHSGGKVKKFALKELPPGIVNNGVIVDAPRLTELLTQMNQEDRALYKNVTLVAGGNAVYVKRIGAPRLTKSQYEQLVRDDFAQSSKDATNLLCGYQLLMSTKDESTAILACASDESQINLYTEVFRAAGIKLKAIRVGAQGILSYIEGRKDLQDKTFVLNVIDGFSITSMIFDRGVNVLLRSTHLVGADERDLAQNILENLSGLIQFAMSEKFNRITDSFYLGITAEELRLLEAYNPHTDIDLKLLNIYGDGDGENLPANAYYAYLSMRLNGKSIDLIKSRKELAKYKKSQRPKKVWIAVILIYVVILSLPFDALYLLNRRAGTEVDELKSYVTGPAVVEKSTQLEEMRDNTALMRDVINQKNAIQSDRDSMVKMSNRVLNLIMDSYGNRVTITKFEFNEATGVVKVSGVGENEGIAADYVNSLRANDMVKEIVYTGYSIGTDGTYSFSIEVTLNGEEA